MECRQNAPCGFMEMESCVVYGRDLERDNCDAIGPVASCISGLSESIYFAKFVGFLAVRSNVFKTVGSRVQKIWAARQANRGVLPGVVGPNAEDGRANLQTTQARSRKNYVRRLAIIARKPVYD